MAICQNQLNRLLKYTKNMKKLSLFGTAFIALLAFTAPSQAQVISVQFQQNGGTALPAGDNAGVVSVNNWNVVPNGSATNAALNDNSGSPTTATVSANSGTYFTGNGFSSPGDAILLAGCLNSSNNSNTSVASIPYANYDVYVYGESDNNSPGDYITFALTPSGGSTEYLTLQATASATSYAQSTSTFNGTGTPPGGIPVANYVEFTGLTGSDFTLAFSGNNGSGVGTFNASMNGFQIVSVPEPSTWAMLLGGFGTLLAFRRRR